eukprot:scaffold3234_cov105-Isochrysis_galbana.AAC.1
MTSRPTRVPRRRRRGSSRQVPTHSSASAPPPAAHAATPFTAAGGGGGNSGAAPPAGAEAPSWAAATPTRAGAPPHPARALRQAVPSQAPVASEAASLGRPRLPPQLQPPPRAGRDPLRARGGDPCAPWRRRRPPWPRHRGGRSEAHPEPAQRRTRHPATRREAAEAASASGGAAARTAASHCKGSGCTRRLRRGCGSRERARAGAGRWPAPPTWPASAPRLAGTAASWGRTACRAAGRRPHRAQRGTSAARRAAAAHAPA